MKKVLPIILIIAVVLVIAFFAFRSYTKSFSPEAIIKFDKNDLNIELKYCRPSKRNREIFGNVVPYDKVWRTGANEASEIEFKQAVNFGGKALKSGKYTLFTIPKKGNWTIILNSTLGQWGAFTYSEAADVLRADVPASSSDKVEEQFTIEIKPADKGASLELRWDKTVVSVPIEK